MAPEVSRDRKKLVWDRAVFKRRITSQLKLAATDDNPDNVRNCISIINSFLDNVREIDAEIAQTYYVDGADVSEELMKELDNQSLYNTELLNKLSALKVCDSPAANSRGELKLPKLPELKCASFDGEGTSQLQFHSFLAQYNNVVGFREDLSGSMKLTYLKSYLKGYAYKLVQHLQIVDLNYKIAIDLLKAEFLNIECLVDDLLKKTFEFKN